MLPATNEVVDVTAKKLDNTLNLAHTPAIPSKTPPNPNLSASSSSSSLSSMNSNGEQKKVSNPLVVVVDASSNDSKKHKDSKGMKESKHNKEKNKEHKLLHRMFHGKDKEKEKEKEMDKMDREDRSEKVSTKLKPMPANLTPQSSFDSDASSVSSYVEKGSLHSHSSSSHHHFVVHDDGTHSHSLSHIGKKENQLLHIFHRERKGHHHRHLPLFDKRDDSATSDKESVLDRMNSKSSKASSMQRSPSQLSLTAKYGQCREICGKGAFGIVRVAHKFQDHREQLFAVKEFKRRETESKRTYIKRLTSEFCISSTLHHTNVIHTIDLLPVDDSSDHYAEVMEYCSGGDVFALVHEFGSLERDEANCFFKQLVNGVGYLHKNGVAHRDLKPENLLLTDDGCLKITDFGNGECFRMAWESESVGVHKSKGVCGSGPYIAPEEFTDEEFDPRRVDVWAVGVIYVALLTGRHLWHIARPSEDELFRSYVEIRRIMDERDQLQKQGKHTHLGKASGVDVIDKLEEGPRQLIYGMLHPDPNKRLTILDIQHNEFFQNIWTCHPPVEENPKKLPISTSNTGTIVPSQSVGVKA